VQPPSILRHLALAALTSVASCAGARLPPAEAPVVERWAFTAPWDPRSAASVRAHAAELDAVVFGWLPLDTLTGLPFELFPDTVARSAPTAVRRMAIVTSFVGDRFHPGTIRGLALDSAALRRSARAIADAALRGGYHGLVLDFEGMTRPDSDATRVVVGEVSRVAHAAGVGPVIVAVPATDTASYPARYFLDVADMLLVMLYDQHWATSPPGPIAAPDWVRQWLGVRIAERGASQLVAALPLYGYRWRPNAFAETIGFDDAVRLATEAGTSLIRDPATATLHAARAGADGWELWVSDAELLAILEYEVRTLGVSRIAYWRLGLEDGAMWPPSPVPPRP
jgi:spore germination protein YaaH